MTTIDIGNEGSGAALSANAMALGADTNLIFELTSPEDNAATYSHDRLTPKGIMAVNRPFTIKKMDAVIKGKFASTHLSTAAGQAISGKIAIRRNAVEVARIDCSIPPAGQIPAPTNVLTDVVPNAASNQLADTTKGWAITAVRKDSAGKTTQSGVSQLWLGKGASLPVMPVYELRFGASNDITQNTLPPITVVPYDKLADKEGALTTFTPQWSFGTFTNNDADVPVPYGMGGNLPAGTVVNFVYGFRLIDDTSIILGNNSIRSFTVDAQGGVACYGGGGSGYQQVYHNTDNKTYIVAEKVLLYKLSTHSLWKVYPPGNSTLNIQNPFSEGSTPDMVPSASIGGATSVYIGFSYYKTPADGANFASRFELKMFCEGRQVAGTGAVKTSGADWPLEYRPTFKLGNDGLVSSFGIMSVGGNASHFRLTENFNNEHLNYQTRAPRGDQYYTANAKVGITVTIPPVPNATHIEIYARPLTYSALGVPGNLTAGVPYQLIYDGPAVNVYEWTGTVLNSNFTVPTANTTANYPASYTGNMSWPVTNPDEIQVLEGDQVVCSLTGASLPGFCLLQVALPVEFLS